MCQGDRLNPHTQRVKGVIPVTVYEAIALMISFGFLMIALLSFIKKK
jgi:hypothetical protein